MVDSSPNSPSPSTPEMIRLRLAMVQDQLIPRGISHHQILAAMRTIPREFFLPESLHQHAYEDRAIPVAEGQTISQPFMVASMSQHLNIGPSNRILEIGTGTGYQTAILCELCNAGEVWTIERNDILRASAVKKLEELGYQNVHCVGGDGSTGLESEAPFDRILVTAGAPEPPPSLLRQLAEGGRMVIPVGQRDVQTLQQYDLEKGRIRQKPLFACRFVPLIGQEGWPA